MIPKRLVALVLERDGRECVLDRPGCWRAATIADHRANRGMGGSRQLDSVANLIAACPSCNGLKEDATGGVLEQLIEYGHRVRHAATSQATLRAAQLTPVRYPDGRFYWLTADGRRVEVSGPPPF
ncbi:HNH endonuclease [Pseudoclavibacter alba]|uniref:HNH endonuclease n=1 Tax=Pseudoclavibacter albus TaxID=272241 RepID=UPI0019D0E81F|nr:HNH endonuclease signature motif containing protein [Pseudoclavibacter alba]MBN6777407.1 HNH endonuclease [Pseudoclavibacter alba]